MAKITQVASTLFEIEPLAEFRAKGWPTLTIRATSRSQAIRHYKQFYKPS